METRIVFVMEASEMARTPVRKSNAARSNPARIDAKEAAGIARKYLEGLMGRRDDIQLEEVELSDDRKQWTISLSYPDSPLHIRIYKQFRIDSSTGEVISMKIRQFS